MKSLRLLLALGAASALFAGLARADHHEGKKSSEGCCKSEKDCSKEGKSCCDKKDAAKEQKKP